MSRFAIAAAAQAVAFAHWEGSRVPGVKMAKTCFDLHAECTIVGHGAVLERQGAVLSDQHSIQIIPANATAADLTLCTLS